MDIAGYTDMYGPRHLNCFYYVTIDPRQLNTTVVYVDISLYNANTFTSHINVLLICIYMYMPCNNYQSSKCVEESPFI